MGTRRAGVVLALATLFAALFSTACYDPRIESCRDPLRDFSSITGVAITNPVFGASLGEGGVGPASYTITAHVSGGVRADCVAVHSELRDATGAVAETIDTPVRAQTSGGVITTTPIFHYHSAGFAPTVHVVALGQTLDVALVRAGTSPDAGVRFDGAVLRDASTLADAAIPLDAATADAGIADDAALADAGP